MELIENFGGDFGVTVVFTKRYSHTVDFFAAEIVGRDCDGDTPLYVKAGATSSEDHVTDPKLAERYVAGGVKWDGCSHIRFGDADAYIHMCGRSAFDKLTAVLPAIYERCGELMQADGINLLDGEFKCCPDNQKPTTR